jgi:hypothetical protein
MGIAACGTEGGVFASCPCTPCDCWDEDAWMGNLCDQCEEGYYGSSCDLCDACDVDNTSPEPIQG